eukprot:2159108-Prymnesium_polylepis.1
MSSPPHCSDSHELAPSLTRMSSPPHWPRSSLEKKLAEARGKLAAKDKVCARVRSCAAGRGRRRAGGVRGGGWAR